MRIARDFVAARPRLERIALAQEIAQDRVDQALGGREAERRRGLDGLIDDGVSGGAGVRKLIESDLEQRPQRGIGQRPRQQRVEVEIDLAQVPQRSVAEVLQGRPVRRRGCRGLAQRPRQAFGEAAPRQHLGDDPAGEALDGEQITRPSRAGARCAPVWRGAC